MVNLAPPWTSEVVNLAPLDLKSGPPGYMAEVVHQATWQKWSTRLVCLLWILLKIAVFGRFYSKSRFWPIFTQKSRFLAIYLAQDQITGGGMPVPPQWVCPYHLFLFGPGPNKWDFWSILRKFDRFCAKLTDFAQNQLKCQNAPASFRVRARFYRVLLKTRKNGVFLHPLGETPPLCQINGQKCAKISHFLHFSGQIQGKTVGFFRPFCQKIP